MQIRIFRKLWLNPTNKLVLYFVISSDVKPHHFRAKILHLPIHANTSEIHLTDSFGFKFSIGKSENENVKWKWNFDFDQTKNIK